MAFGTKPHYQIRQIAGRHFFQTANQAGVGRQVIESVIQELLDGATSVVESVIASLPKNFPDEVASSIEAGIKRRLRLLGIVNLTRRRSSK
jgi:serine/threonine-protein kinase HipA